jgi:hypothetical protein
MTQPWGYDPALSFIGGSLDRYHGDGTMSQAAKTTDRGRASSHISPDSDVLRFLKRTLQFHSSDSRKEDVFEKLQNLKNALDRQEATLLSWPDSPSKDRIRESLSKAKTLVEEIVESFADGARNSTPGEIETA